ncbi:MAG: hypothetical protein A2663_02255 [Candidatus Buchananbacteria bacterium RIFCSPHIGHO2_01_FULL_46_12]|uniref:Uncharacterized protein n=3 Tax=Candidatus Buchananiibacteriota TaxID=1817903 RepID=A0A1G1Y7K7_9BACT|nr:MAG: hypothetical protein A2663_02255 [Candidatus Buchananbacteria bacterium RIFCSPHIGHO2_01_FULL_46_12]OGY56648.1 MAG: hypothetical protein A3H67_00400 [Candidatus Buchananbacteria bacterium RIFCSPLOWO2_02_FULL_46_11b]
MKDTFMIEMMEEADDLPPKYVRTLISMMGSMDNVKEVLHNRKIIKLEDAVRLLFDKNGRRIPWNLRAAVCDPDPDFKLAGQEKVDFASRLSRLADALEMAVPITAARFEDEAGQLVELVKTAANGLCANILKGVCLPIIVPQTTEGDYGAVLESFYLPALERAYKKEYPSRAFTNHPKGKLANQVTIVPDICHDRLAAKSRLGWQVILFFPNPLQGFSVHAQREQLAQLPEEFSLAGGIDGLPAWTMWVDVLTRDHQTPGFDLSALQWQASAYSLCVRAGATGTVFGCESGLGHALGLCSGGLSFAR